VTGVDATAEREGAAATLGGYRLGPRLAVGGMAEVFHATRVGPGGFAKPLVIKRLLPELAADAGFVAMFTDEARLMARLSHPNLVAVFDYGEEAGQPYVVMEHVGGRTLAQALAARRPLPAPVALLIAAELCRALGYVHAFQHEGSHLAIVHRDVSPGNVFLTCEGAVKLGDFGIAKARGRRVATERGQLKGTLAYMAPEQARGEDVDGRTDLYGVGLILYEMLTGRGFLTGETDAALFRAALAPPTLDERTLPAGAAPVAAVLRRALCPHAEGRFADAAALEAVLRALATSAAPGIGAADLAAVVAEAARAPRAGRGEAAEAGDSGRAPPNSAPADERAAGPTAATRQTLAYTHPPSRRRAWLVGAVVIAAAAASVVGWTVGRPRRLPTTTTAPAAAGPPARAVEPAVRAAAQVAPAPAAAIARRAPEPRPPATPAARPLRGAADVGAPAPTDGGTTPARPAATAAGSGVTPAAPARAAAALASTRQRRRLSLGDAAACDRAAERALQPGGSEEAVAAARACYEGVTIDLPFIERKLARIGRDVAAAGRDRDPTIQRLSKAVLDLVVAGRYEDANRALGDVRTALDRPADGR
jgi:serine/threonine-protein kinase